MKIILYLILTLSIPIGCSYSGNSYIKQEKNQFSYSTINELISNIEINKTILRSSIGVKNINFPAINLNTQISKIHVLNAYHAQLNEIISAFKQVLLKSQKQYFKNMSLSVILSDKATNKIQLKNGKKDQLNITMGLHINPNEQSNSISTLDKERIYSFVAKNLKYFK